LPPWAVAYAILALATVVIGAVNTLSVVDEHAWMGRPIAWWRPAVWEGTSGIVLMALAWLPMLAIRRFPLAGPHRLRNLAIHFALTLPFSVVHVATMVALRQLAYALAGDSYSFDRGWQPWLYEYRKDVLSYTLYAALFWLTSRLMGGIPTQPSPPAPPPAPELIVIDEGQRIMRVPPASVLAVRSCGNYVEFVLGDGRRPLMRTTLAALCEQLAGKGFVRTHRSWLVNKARVSEVVAEGSGDYGLTLDDGTAVPLSRRYPDALAAVRRGG
jgi:hypothetical protein